MEFERAMRDEVAGWEENLLDILGEWMEVAAADPDLAKNRQTTMRRRALWFNSLYVWDPPKRVVYGPDDVRMTSVIRFPNRPIDDSDTASPYCVERARDLRSNPTLPPQMVASAYLLGCRNQDLGTRIYASTEAATHLANQALYSDALEALDAAGLDDSITLAQAVDQDVSPFRVATLRLLRAQVIDRSSPSSSTTAPLSEIAMQITGLDAPDAESLLQYVRYPILPALRQSGALNKVERVEASLARAERRVAAFREISERVVHQMPSSTTSEAPRLIRDQYSASPFLLFYGWPSENGVALQLEQGALMADLLSSKAMSRYRRWLTVTDSTGTLLAGARQGGPIAVSVDLPRTLPHLKLSLRQGAIDARTDQTRDQWLTPLLIVGLCALLGLWALWTLLAASRQQTHLLMRQREFTTRVTHELKTPLAGIRVMAENLENGAFSDPQQVSEMGRRIVGETDRLTARVDEVLAVSKERRIPEPEPFDIEEVLLEAIDSWGPRLENAGVRLYADLHPTGMAEGDPVAIRDAISCLLDNALKYRQADRPEPTVWLILTQSGETAQIEVQDNGIGVPEDQREHIFERFARIEGPNRGMAGGYGLGLSQVLAIAEAHGGRAWCDGGPEGRTRFVFSLPVEAFEL